MEEEFRSRNQMTTSQNTRQHFARSLMGLRSQWCTPDKIKSQIQRGQGSIFKSLGIFCLWYQWPSALDKAHKELRVSSSLNGVGWNVWEKSQFRVELRWLIWEGQGHTCYQYHVNLRPVRFFLGKTTRCLLDISPQTDRIWEKYVYEQHIAGREDKDDMSVVN